MGQFDFNGKPFLSNVGEADTLLNPNMAERYRRAIAGMTPEEKRIWRKNNLRTVNNLSSRYRMTNGERSEIRYNNAVRPALAAYEAYREAHPNIKPADAMRSVVRSHPGITRNMDENTTLRFINQFLYNDKRTTEDFRPQYEKEYYPMLDPAYVSMYREATKNMTPEQKAAWRAANRTQSSWIGRKFKDVNSFWRNTIRRANTDTGNNRAYLLTHDPNIGMGQQAAVNLVKELQSTGNNVVGHMGALNPVSNKLFHLKKHPIIGGIVGGSLSVAGERAAKQFSDNYLPFGGGEGDYFNWVNRYTKDPLEESGTAGIVGANTAARLALDLKALSSGGKQRKFHTSPLDSKFWAHNWNTFRKHPFTNLFVKAPVKAGVSGLVLSPFYSFTGDFPFISPHMPTYENDKLKKEIEQHALENDKTAFINGVANGKIKYYPYGPDAYYSAGNGFSNFKHFDDAQMVGKDVELKTQLNIPLGNGEKVTVTTPKGLVDAINSSVDENGASRYGFFIKQVDAGKDSRGRQSYVYNPEIVDKLVAEGVLDETDAKNIASYVQKSALANATTNRESNGSPEQNMLPEATNQKIDPPQDTTPTVIDREDKTKESDKQVDAWKAFYDFNYKDPMEWFKRGGGAALGGLTANALGAGRFGTALGAAGGWLAGSVVDRLPDWWDKFINATKGKDA